MKTDVLVKPLRLVQPKKAAGSGRGQLWRLWPRWSRSLSLLYIVLPVVSLHRYIDWRSAQFITGALAILLLPAGSMASGHPLRFGYGAIACFLLFLLLPVKTVLYLALTFAVFFFRESFYAGIDRCLIFIVLLCSPMAEYAANLFSFPIRLQLTHWAGNMIRYVGVPVRTEGNLLNCNGNEFYVDPACMGLHMLIVSLLAGIMLILIYQVKFQRRLGMIYIVSILITVMILNILANLLRIVFLTLFCILPENPMHALTGIVCLLTYVILPMIPCCRWLVRRYGKPDPGRAAPPKRRYFESFGLLAGNLLVAGCMIVATSLSWVHDRDYLGPGKVAEGDMIIGKGLPCEGIPGQPAYTTERLAGNTLKLYNGRSLIYIKPIPDFYYTDHLPAICWPGSGYVFIQAKEESIGGQVLYTGTLQHGKERLCTAWWYDNGVHRTTGQLDWRWDVLRGGRKYSVVNITAASREDLEKEVRNVLEKGILNGLI